MIPVVFVNCSKHPFIDLIMARRKPFETRTRNTLGRFLGDTILFAETGHGKPLARCYAKIVEIIEVFTREEWEKYREAACIPADSDFDWKPWTRKKVLYRLDEVVAIDPFRITDGIRHGRVWMEYEGKEVRT